MSAGVHACARGGRVIQRWRNKNPRWGMWITSCTGSERGGFGGIWKSELSWVATEEDGWLSLARGGFATGAHVCGGGRWKSQNRKNVYLSPYVEKPLNSKVIISFVPELRSRTCFSCFGIPMFYVYMLRTFYVRFAYPYHGYGTILKSMNNKKAPKMSTILLQWELVVPHIPSFLRVPLWSPCVRLS